MEYKYYLSRLNGRERELYAPILRHLTEGTEAFEADADAETIHRVIRAVMLDNPELFWFTGKWKAQKTPTATRVLPQYTCGRAERNEVSHRIEQRIRTMPLPQETNAVARIKAVYDWLLDNVRYGASPHDQTVEGVFADGVAVCKGIARAFQLCMNRLEIPSLLLEGTIDGQASHIWNVVFADGLFYHVDVTMGYSCFASLFPDPARRRRYPCFMVSDSLLSHTHTAYCRSTIRCTQDLDLEDFLTAYLEIPPRFTALGELKYLDTGSTCTVFSIRGDRGSFALKVITEESEATLAHKHAEELQILKRLSDADGVVRLIAYEINRPRATLYLLMPQYRTLAAYRRERTALTPDEVIRIGIQILKAMLQCRSRGIYHLDIQPKNIYVDGDGNALLGDFGGSAFETELDSLGHMRGTLAFMAPEVYESGAYSQASEIYSLGIVLYALLNDAKLPFFDPHDPQATARQRLTGAPLPPGKIPPALLPTIQRMCAPRLEERYQRFEEALEALEKRMRNGGYD